MKFVSVRDLRGKAAEIWKTLPGEGEMVITSNGRPIAILAAVNESNLEESLSAFRRARAVEAAANLQRNRFDEGLRRSPWMRSTPRSRRCGGNGPDENRPGHERPGRRPSHAVRALRQIVRLISSGEVTLCLDARILSEYDEVLRRPKFRFDMDKVTALLDYIEHSGELAASSPLSDPLPDPDDHPFLEVALACRVACLVTGNLVIFRRSAARKSKCSRPPSSSNRSKPAATTLMRQSVRRAQVVTPLKPIARADSGSPGRTTGAVEA